MTYEEHQMRRIIYTPATIGIVLGIITLAAPAAALAGGLSGGVVNN